MMIGALGANAQMVSSSDVKTAVASILETNYRKMTNGDVEVKVSATPFAQLQLPDGRVNSHWYSYAYRYYQDEQRHPDGHKESRPDLVEHRPAAKVRHPEIAFCNDILQVIDIPFRNGKVVAQVMVERVNGLLLRRWPKDHPTWVSRCKPHDKEDNKCDAKYCGD